MVYILLFVAFFQIALFGYGGSEGLLSIMEHEIVVVNHWLTPAQFANLMAFSRILPGDFCVGTSAFVGYLATTEFGFWAALGGGATATFSLSLPSILLANFSKRISNFLRLDEAKESIMALLRPIVPGLVAGALLLLCTDDIIGSPEEQPWQFYINIFLFAATLIGTRLYHINATVMVFLCGIAGLFLF